MRSIRRIFSRSRKPTRQQSGQKPPDIPHGRLQPRRKFSSFRALQILARRFAMGDGTNNNIPSMSSSPIRNPVANFFKHRTSFSSLSSSRPDNMPFILQHNRFFSDNVNPSNNNTSENNNESPNENDTSREQETEPSHPHPQGALQAAIHWNQEQLKHLRYWQRQFYFRLSMACLVVSLGLYFGWDHISPLISEPLAALFGDTVSHPELQDKTQEVSKTVVMEVLRDEMIQGQTTDFFIDILTRDATMITLEALFKDLFQRPEIIAAAVNLLVTTFNDDYVAEQAAEFTEPVMKTAVLNLLQDDDVKEFAVQFLKEVINDAEIQTQTSDALYQVIVDAFTPNVLSRKKRGDRRALVSVATQTGENFELDASTKQGGGDGEDDDNRPPPDDGTNESTLFT